MCCNGVPQKRAHGLPGCCGQVSYNLNTHVCCNGEIQERDDITTCPPNNCYNTTEYICCDAGAMSPTNGVEMMCCGSLSYIPEYYECCNGQVVEREYEGDSCCGFLHFKSSTHKCCGGVLTPVDKERKDFMNCCGIFAYYPSDGLCCNNRYPETLYKC